MKILKNKRQTTDFYGVSLLLSLAGGFFDAYSYLCRDKVFANAQTGNMVLLAANAVERHWIKVLLYLCPILAFTVGILIAEILKAKFKLHPKLHWHQLILEFEILIVAAIAFIPQGGHYNNVANIFISFVCAMQYQGFKRVEGKPYASTMCTGNLRSATVNFFQYCTTKKKENLTISKRYITVNFSFIIGAAFGALLVPRLGEKAILLAAAELIIVLLMLKYGEKTHYKEVNIE